MILKRKSPEIRSRPGGAPPLRIYVSSNGKGKPARIDGKLSAHTAEDYKFVEWTASIGRKHLTLTLTLTSTATERSMRLINRGWARGYFSLQALRYEIAEEKLIKLGDPELVEYTKHERMKELHFRIPLDKN